MVELRIITGRAGAGKSRWVLDRMAARRGQCGQVLLVPEHATHEAELDLCRALGDTASRDGEVLSFQSLATRVLAQTGGLAEVTLDNGGKILTMRRALQEVASYLTVFARPSQRPAFLRELVALADELYAYRVAPQELMEQVQAIPARRERSCAPRRCCSARMTPGSTAAGGTPGQGCRSCATHCRSPAIWRARMCTSTGSPTSTVWRRTSSPGCCGRRTA